MQIGLLLVMFDKLNGDMTDNQLCIFLIFKTSIYFHHLSGNIVFFLFAILERENFRGFYLAFPIMIALIPITGTSC